MASPLTSDEAVAVGATAAAKEQHLRGPAPPHAAGVEPHAALIHATTPLLSYPIPFPNSRNPTKKKKRKENNLGTRARLRPLKARARRNTSPATRAAQRPPQPRPQRRVG
jgi:hypothetical protein